MKISPVGAKVLHANGWMDRQTDMTKLIDTLHNFVNTPTNGCSSIHAIIWR